jgi:sugar/nucleoside kinase (ribokinase family)
MSDERLDVVGIGSMVVDRVHRSPRILGADEKGILRAVSGGGPVQSAVGGVVLNHLGWAAALGLRTGIFGRQARDENGLFLRAAMDRAGIERSLDLAGSASSFAEIFVDDGGDRAIYMAPGATAETRPEHVREHEAFVARAAHLTTEVSQLPLDSAFEALRIARAHGATTVVDLDVPPSDAIASGLGDADQLDALLRAADWLKPSKSAARELVPEAGGDPLAVARALRARLGSRAVVVTDGEAGCAVAAEDFEGFVPTRPVKAVDSTGAGDAFLGGLLAARCAGFDWSTSARLANACGAACVERIGAFPEDADAARARVLELYDGSALPERARSAPATDAAPAADEALALLDVALAELAALRGRLGAAAFDAALGLLREARERGARLHVTGVGKPEHLAHYAASLFSSTGTPASFLHATEAVHGSAGQVVEGDVVIAISNSGDTAELRAAAEAVRGGQRCRRAAGAGRVVGRARAADRADAGRVPPPSPRGKARQAVRRPERLSQQAASPQVSGAGADEPPHAGGFSPLRTEARASPGEPRWPPPPCSTLPPMRASSTSSSPPSTPTTPGTTAPSRRACATSTRRRSASSGMARPISTGAFRSIRAPRSCPRPSTRCRTTGPFGASLRPSRRAAATPPARGSCPSVCTASRAR